MWCMIVYSLDVNITSQVYSTSIKERQVVNREVWCQSISLHTIRSVYSIHKPSESSSFNRLAIIKTNLFGSVIRQPCLSTDKSSSV